MEMTIKNVVIDLLWYCNAECKHCLKSLNTAESRYKMSWEEFQLFIHDMESLAKYNPDLEIKLSGGEPTIWKDGNHDICDLLDKLNEKKLKYGIATNGLTFLDKNRAKVILGHLSSLGKVFVTIDSWHQNTNDIADQILENILEYIDPNQLCIQTTISADKTKNLPISFLEKYKYLRFNLNPLLPLGEAMSYKTLIPTLSLKGTDKSTLGDYEKFLYMIGRNNQLWNSYDEFCATDNSVVFLNTGKCGKTITLTDRKYSYCIPRNGQQEFQLGKLGEFSVKDYLSLISSNDFLMSLVFSPESLINSLHDKTLENEQFSLMFGLCDFCQKNYRNSDNVL